MSTPLKGPVNVSPRVDCVFKELMRRPAILLDVLNAVLDATPPIVAVALKEAVHLPDFVGDDYTAVDVKATDAAGRIYEIEMQTWNETALKERMLYCWADLYEEQLVKGQGYEELNPVIAIWFLDRNIFRDAPRCHHRLRVCDPRPPDVGLTDHLEIHTLELQKWRMGWGPASPNLTRWLRFLSEAEQWSEVPSDLATPALEEAMDVLTEFHDNAEWQHAYRTRLDAQRRRITAEREALRLEEERQRAEEKSKRAEEERQRAEEERQRAEEENLRLRGQLEQAIARAERERADKERERVDKERAEDRVERMRRRLEALGVDPNAVE